MLIAANALAPFIRACATGVDSSPSMPDTAAAKNSDVAEFETLVAAGEITELRTTSNGSYGASLS
ncbi:hypothetical protein BTHE68_28640 [Burkholderia sp. THE68]|nr:hypothetical protein BTHE68_28640 [Burkholderia sp. THE68]